MQTLKSILNRLNNKGTIISLVALGVSLVAQFGIEVDSAKVMAIVEAITGIAIILGVLNDPTNGTNGYIPGVSDKLVKKKVKEEIEEVK